MSKSKSKSKSKIPFKVGTSYFIRSVTYHSVGRVKSVIGNFLVLENASWVADSGRFNEMLKTGIFSELEPFEDDAIISINAIVDATEFNHVLPHEVA